MTRVCLRCGWLVLGGERCTRDDGPTLKWQSAARVCLVPSLRRLLELEPAVRVERFAIARDRLRQSARRARVERIAELEATP